MDTEFAELGFPRFRGKQVRDWVYAKEVTDPAHMTNLPAADRASLSAAYAFDSASIIAAQCSEDGTHKLLLGWNADATGAADIAGAQAETVLIPDADRRTACVSSQVGCPVGCRFCASGIGGVKRNLTAGQIVEQVISINRVLARQSPAWRYATIE